MIARVLIAIPSRDSWSPSFGMSLCVLVSGTQRLADKAGLGEIGISIVNQSSSLVHANRQYLAERALAMEATHLLFLDDDMAFPSDTLVRLLQANKPVVAASYVKRELPLVPLAYDLNGDTIDSTGKHGRQEVAAVATGCMLIDLAVLDSLPKPWFDTVYVPETGKFRGEDIYFCESVRRAGFSVWVDHDLSCAVRHSGTCDYYFGMCE